MNYVLSQEMKDKLSTMLNSLTYNVGSQGGVGEIENTVVGWIYLSSDLSTYSDGEVQTVNGYTYIYLGYPCVWDSKAKDWFQYSDTFKVIPSDGSPLSVGSRVFCQMTGYDGEIYTSGSLSVNGFPTNETGGEVAPIWMPVGNIGCYPVVVITGVSCSADGGLDVQTTTIGSCSPYTYGT